MTSMLDAALDLLTKQECSVIPVRANKRPLFDWAEFQTRRPSCDPGYTDVADMPGQWAGPIPMPEDAR